MMQRDFYVFKKSCFIFSFMAKKRVEKGERDILRSKVDFRLPLLTK